MRHLLIFIIACVLTAGYACKKDNDADGLVGTVIQKGGCNSNSWLVRLENPERAKAFTCDPALGLPSGGYDCTNSFFIDLPAHLAQAGKRIRFDIVGTQLTCMSSSTAPVHADVARLR